MVVNIGEGRRAKKPPLVFTCVKKSPLNEEYGAVSHGLFAYAPVLLSLCKLSRMNARAAGTVSYPTA